MSTPHISAEMGDFAKTVLMPGVREACRTPIQYREYLITDGLYRIWQKNRKG